MRVILTDHARERCTEMAVRSRRVKKIVADPDVDYVSGDERVCYAQDDDIAVVYKPGEPAVVLTVVWRCIPDYVRTGAGFVTTNEETQ